MTDSTAPGLSLCGRLCSAGCTEPCGLGKCLDLLLQSLQTGLNICESLSFSHMYLLAKIM